MATPVTRPARLRPAGVVVRLAVVVTLLVLGNALISDVRLPAPPGIAALVGYLAAVVFGGIHAADFLSDRYDRVRDRRRG